MAFAKSGNPNGANRLAWPAFSAAGEEIMEFTNEGPRTSGIPRKAGLAALSAAYR